MDPVPTALAAVVLWTAAAASAALFWAALARARRREPARPESPAPRPPGAAPARRPSVSREREGRIRRAGYRALVLDRLALHGATALGADELRLEVRPHQGHGATVLAAAAGPAAERVGDRAPASGIVSEVLAGGAPRLVASPDPRTRSSGALEGSSVAAPVLFGGAVQAALVAHRGPGREAFELRELELLGAVAEAAAPALEHLSCGEALELTLADQMDALSAAVRAREQVTASQSAALADLAEEVGRLLGLDEPARVELCHAVRLHDTGTLRVPDRVLSRTGRLSPGDEQLARRHPAWGARILADVPGLEAVALIVRLHRERWDGRGYPHGLSGERIPLASRIVFACAALGAMISERPYREALPPAAALAELRERSGTQFDPRVVEAVHAAWPHAYHEDLVGEAA